MKTLSVVAAIAVVVLVLTAPASAFNWTHVGRAPLLGEVNDVLDLQQKVVQHDAELRQVFSLAGVPTGLYDAFKQAVMAGQVRETTKAVGTSFVWMGYRPIQVTVARDVLWRGEQPLNGFEVPVRFGEQIHYFFIPKKCGNVALQTILAAPVAPRSSWTGHTQQRVAPQPAPQPQQQLVIAPVRVYRVVRYQRTVWPADVWVQGPFGPQRLSGYTIGPNPNQGIFVPNVWQID